MAARLADQPGFRRAMNTVPIAAQVDPYDAHRIVRAWSDGEGLVGTPTAAGWIEMICGVRRNCPHLQLIVGRRMNVTSDRRRIGRE